MRLLLALLSMAALAEPFAVLPSFTRQSCSILFSSTAPASSMRVSEIKEELKELGVSFHDCFDKESLAQKLTAAREGGGKKEEANANSEKENVESKAPSPEPKAQSPAPPSVDFSSMKVKELREECGRRGIRWGTFVEKGDFVKAILADDALSAGFSPSGKLKPGAAGDVTGEDLERELAEDGLLLLDVYATWCGPCQLVAPQLAEAASEWKRAVRVAKMDSDKNPEMSSKLRVQGLPTFVLFKDGKEVERIEGAVMKDGLLKLVEKHMD